MAEMGMNKTGISTAPQMSKEMIASSSDFPIARDGVITPEEFRLQYIEQGVTVGSVPPPLSLKGMAKSAVQALQGKKATLLVDKLSERLAFERSGVGRYEALMLKARAMDGAGATLPKLERICREELEHFQMLWACIEQLGADPTVQTPSADVAAVASQGIPKVLLDPRTTFPQCLEAFLIAELVDCDAWERLAELAEGFNQTEMTEKFRQAVRAENEHRMIIRSLVEERANEEAGVATAARH
jgi:tRNA isopentenyl-2-thiomethyl-A-37 hydroxylase MiaE